MQVLNFFANLGVSQASNSKDEKLYTTIFIKILLSKVEKKGREGQKDL